MNKKILDCNCIIDISFMGLKTFTIKCDYHRKNYKAIKKELDK